jgi:predicted amidophosphoribosyltransferase
VATRSPRLYAERVVEEFGIEIGVLHAGSGNKAASVRACALDLGAEPSEIVLVGDDESDIRAARELNATSLGAVWGRSAWDDRMQPDLSVVDPSLLLEHADWWRLTYLAEQHDLEVKPVIHAGSWITYGGLQTYALGRYFVARNQRHNEFLTQAILRGKAATDPEPAIARAVSMLGAHIRDHAAVDVVTSVPGAHGRADRFAKYREVTAEAFDAANEMALMEVRAVGPLKGMSHEARAAANQGRFSADASVEGLHVLVLDDVITSGSTLKACAEALKDAGASEVSCVSFAGTQD